MSPGWPQPYAPPPPQGSPPVWTWYLVYAVVMALLYLFVMLLGAAMLVGGVGFADEIGQGSEQVAVSGGLYVAIGLPFFGAFAAAPFLPKKPWAWVYHIVLIGLGLTSVCCLPASIPLLIHWLKPETKHFFGRV